MRKSRRYQTVADKIARKIQAGIYGLGDHLPPERELAALHGVGRPTIREAIIALELQGLVEVKVGSGVYVIAKAPAENREIPMDVGPFELTEARLIFEAEVAALAATLISAEELEELRTLLEQMQEGNESGRGEIADRRFHQCIAEATRNSAMVAVVESLWATHERSPQCARLFENMRAMGYHPVISEHRAIFEALRVHDANAARNAMRVHLRRVLDYLLDTSEVEMIDETKAKISARRERFAAAGRR